MKQPLGRFKHAEHFLLDPHNQMIVEECRGPRLKGWPVIGGWSYSFLYQNHPLSVLVSESVRTEPRRLLLWLEGGPFFAVPAERLVDILVWGMDNWSHLRLLLWEGEQCEISLYINVVSLSVFNVFLVFLWDNILMQRIVLKMICLRR